MTPKAISTPTVPAYPAPVSQSEPQKNFWQQVVDFLFGDHTPVVSAHDSPSANAIPGAPGALRIDYVYDPLNRLTAANYGNGSYFHYKYSMPGNIFYAYVGRAAGFSEFEIRTGAVYAQQTDPENNLWKNDWWGLDQASDQAAISLGFYIFNQVSRS